MLTDVVRMAAGGGSRVLDIKALSMPEGEAIALLGPNGAGKSALLAVLAGELPTTQGEVLLDGVEIGDIAVRDLRRGVGVLETATCKQARTLRDALTLQHVATNPVHQIAALDFAGLSYQLTDPRGLDRPIARALSGGELHALALARLWLADPRVVLLDDPLQALDQQRRAAMLPKLRHWLRGRTAVIATHDPLLVDLCTQMVVMQRGQIAMSGPREAVLAQMRQAGRS